MGNGGWQWRRDRNDIDHPTNCGSSHRTGCRRASLPNGDRNGGSRSGRPAILRECFRSVVERFTSHHGGITVRQKSKLVAPSSFSTNCQHAVACSPPKFSRDRPFLRSGKYCSHAPRLITSCRKPQATEHSDSWSQTSGRPEHCTQEDSGCIRDRSQKPTRFGGLTIRC